MPERSDSSYEAAKKRRARMAVYRAVQSGELIRPDACERCEKECKPDGAHLDYDKPLEVLWLCRSCHSRRDVDLEVPISISSDERRLMERDLVPVTVYLPEALINEYRREAAESYDSLSTIIRRQIVQAFRRDQTRVEGGDQPRT